MKKYLIIFLSFLRALVGRAECAVEGRCQSDTDCFDFEPGVSRFYECRRCGRDAITGQTFRQWYEGRAQ